MRRFNILFSTIFLVNSTLAQCPWQRDIPDLQTSCLCAYNLGHELSVQCDQVDFPLLIDALDRFTRKTPIDLLYVNNSTIDKLTNNIFINLRLHNLQLSSCKIREINDKAFDGQELVLKNLNLQDNKLNVVPVNAINILQILNLLDLSKNHIKQIDDNTFFNLKKLTTLKLSDNNVALSTDAFRGIELSLKNLNLKGTRQKSIPECIRGLKKLAFLDLSQNGIQELPGIGGIHTFGGLDSLTALNLERNLIQTLGETSFAGVRKTLSSLSLLNNLLAEFPVGAIHSLKELRVLDIGFNLLTALPESSFRGNPSVTLLALDGNPLQTVPEKAMTHLNRTLRGLSLGGRFLHCDCKLQWVAEWIRNGDLQVTSRERNPQFCGTPTRFHDRGFYSIQPEELTCPESNIDLQGPIGVVESLVPPQMHIVAPTIGEIIPPVIIPSTTSVSPPSTQKQHGTTQLITQPSPTPISTTTNTTITVSSILPNITTTFITSTDLPSTSIYNSSLLPQSTTDATQNFIKMESTTMKPPINTSASWKQQHPTQQHHLQSNSPSVKQRPPLVLGFPAGRGSTLRADDTNEVNVKNAFRQDNSVIIQWDSGTVNILGFRVVYRLFADKSFKQGPPLEASEREFKIKNVPTQECLVVCVISLEEINVTPETVPYSQCREVRTNASTHSNLDKITIAASAAVCGTIIVAVIVYIAACHRRSKKLQSLHSTHKNPLPIAGLPVNCCVPTGSPGPLGSIATLSAFNHHKDWDQVSAYSGRSIPRPRIYPIDNSNIADDLRSHVSNFSAVGGCGGNSVTGVNSSNGAISNGNGKSGNLRSIADGQSQYSFSNHSHRGYLGSAFPTNLVNSRPELRQSRQSLTAASDRMSHASYAASVAHAPSTQSVTSNSRRTRPRSRSREQLNGTHVYSHRPGSRRYSTTGSQHTLNNYCDTSDNWTDHDMDIYIARNATTRNGLVPL